MSTNEASVRSHRLGGGRLLAWVISVLAAAAGVQALLGGNAPADKAIGVLAAVAIVCTCVLLGLRPRVVELPAALEIRNPLRSASLPWASITEIDAVDVVRVTAGDVVVRCYALPRRDRRPITSGMASFFGGRTLPDNEPMRTSVTTADVVESLRRRAGVGGAGSSSPEVPPFLRYDPWAVAVLVLGVVSGVACAIVVVAA
jgi:hypothetical protein